VQRAWLASSAVWVRLPLLPACQVRFLSACYEIKFSGRCRGLAFVLLKCDRPSHPDWGRLGVVRAAGVYNRWKVPAVLARETRRLSWVLKIYSASPSVRGDTHWARPRPQCWRWLEARRNRNETSRRSSDFAKILFIRN